MKFWLAIIVTLMLCGSLHAQAGPAPVFDVRKFGATPDDGTDDTSAIQAAIDAAEASSPADVIFPRGVYEVTTLITVDTANVRVVGADGAVIRAKQTATATNAMLLLDANYTEVVNLEIDGNYPSVTPNGDGKGIIIGDVDDVKVRDCYVHDTYGSGIVTQQGGEHHSIVNCDIYDAGLDGINASGDVVIIDGCEIIDWNRRNASGSRAIKVDPQDYDADSVDISNCTITMRDESLNYVDEILIDPGDGDKVASDSSWLDTGNSGEPVEDGSNAAGAGLSYAQFSIDAGHGFMPGDMIWLSNGISTDAAAYNDLAHVIRSLGGTGGLIDGNVFIRKVDANTITLHASAIDAKGPARSNTAQAVSATSITLDASASATTNFYLGMSVKITNGAASGSIGQIVSYSGTTKVATVHGWSASTPTGTPTFTVGPTIDLTSTGSGTFYVGSPSARAKRIEVTASTGVNTTTDVITCTGHGFRSGFMARLTVDDASDGDLLPGGLANTATVTISVPYSGDTDNVSGLQYRRPKRIRNATIRNVTITHAPGLVTSGTNGIKVNNVENLLIDRINQHQPPEYPGVQFTAVRLGQNNRKVSILNSRFAGQLKINTATWIPELLIDNCEFGDAEYANSIALETIAATNLTLRNSMLRFRTYGINSSEDADVDFDGKVGLWDIHDNIFEAYKATTAQALDFESSDQGLESRKIRFYSNTRRNVHPNYRGLAVSSVSSTTLTHAASSGVTTGGLVQVRLNGGALTGATDEAMYYSRRRTNTTLSLHPTEADAVADTNGVSVSGLSGSVTIYSQELGVARSDLTTRDVSLRQVPGNERQFYDVVAPTSAGFTWNAGDIVWNVHATRTNLQPPGWICTAPGAPGTWTAMLPLNDGSAVAETTEVGNVGTGVDDLLSYTLPANAIAAVGGSLEIEAGFTFAANGNNKQVKLLIDGQEYYASGAVAQNSGSMVLKITLIYDSVGVSKFSSAVQTTGSGAVPNVALVNGGIYTATQANIIKCTGEATSNNDIVQEYLRVRVLPAP